MRTSLLERIQLGRGLGSGLRPRTDSVIIRYTGTHRVSSETCSAIQTNAYAILMSVKCRKRVSYTFFLDVA